MISIKLPALLLCLFFYGATEAQQTKETVKAEPDQWTVYNRKVKFENDEIHLNAQASDGILWLNNSDFENGTIEFDIKGKNTPGQSFVGVVFHAKDSSTFDCVYFRPFNFRNPERNSHSVQYMAFPGNDWSVLRNAFPGKYENPINPVPDPVDGWFHTTIIVDHPTVKVYVNESEDPTLEVEQLTHQKQGKIGLWVGNNSEGWFKNLIITPKQ